MNREEVIKIAREAGFESHDAMINTQKNCNALLLWLLKKKEKNVWIYA